MDRSATAAEAASFPWKGVVEGLGNAGKGLEKAAENVVDSKSKMVKEYVRNPNQALQELRLCRMYVQANQNGNQVAANILVQLEKYFNQMNPLQVLRMCTSIVNQQENQP